MNWIQRKNITVNLSPLSVAAADDFFVTLTLTMYARFSLEMPFVKNSILSVRCRLEIPLALYFIAVVGTGPKRTAQKKEVGEML